MTLALELGIFCIGVIALFTGKFHLGNNRSLKGPAAQLLGLLAIVPLPMALCIGFYIGWECGKQNLDLDDVIPTITFTLVELGYALFSAGVIFGTAHMLAKARREYRRLLRDLEDEYDDYDDRRTDFDDEDDSRRRYFEPPPPPSWAIWVVFAYIAVLGVGLSLGVYAIAFVEAKLR